jgi:phosphotransferase family enzyme
VSESAPLERWAELVLVTAEGVVVGRLPPVRTDKPWWPEVESVVAAVRERYGIDVTILRLLGSERSSPPGGRVTYLAEVADGVRGEPRSWAPDALDALDEHPLRREYARPGGPQRDLDWAHGVLARQGLAPSGRAQQIKTWNLSSLWRIPLREPVAMATGATSNALAEPFAAVWLKVVPPFFAHEGPLIGAMPAGAPVPRLLGHADPGRSLLAELPGEDLFRASLAQRVSMLDLLVGLQLEWCGRVDELLGLGLPDWRGPALQRDIRSVFERTRPELGSEPIEVLTAFIDELPQRLDELSAAGLPETLVHGDFHCGNVRGFGTRMTLIDWGDAGVGHPLLDHAAFLERAPAEFHAPLEAHWKQLCLRAWPGSDPQRAWSLVAPLAAARQAVMYRKFLDAIEPSEHVYHRSDPATWLRRTAELVQGPLESVSGSLPRA